MKRTRAVICGSVFVLLLLALFAFLRLFTAGETPYDAIVWKSAYVSGADGARVSFDPNDLKNLPAQEEGKLYSFTALLPEVPYDGSLLFNYGGAEVTLYLNGTEIFRSTAPSDAVTAWGWTEALVPLDPDADGAELTMTLTILPGEQSDMLPPALNVVSNGLREAEAIATANLYALPAGAFALALTFICALFLLGLYEKKPDWKLLALVVALAALILRWLEMNGGLYFLPRDISEALGSDLVRLLPTLSILLYLALGRTRAFWRRMGIVSIFCAAALVLAYLVSLAVSGDYSCFVNSIVSNLFEYGDWRTPVYWLTVYLVYASTLLAAYGHISAVAATQTEARVLAMKNELAMESCRAMEQSSRRTAELRHELKSHAAAMTAMLKSGNTQELERYLGELDSLQKGLIPTRYTENFLVNAILQNAAIRAAEGDIRFEAHANVPEEVGVAETDLSTLFMNMLDNALEAAAAVQPPKARFIRVSTELKNGFLAVSCKNSYAGKLRLDEKDRIVSSKPDTETHGFGLKQMRGVAEKYDSIIDIGYTEDVFTVQTALQTKKRHAKA